MPPSLSVMIKLNSHELFCINCFEDYRIANQTRTESLLCIRHHTFSHLVHITISLQNKNQQWEKQGTERFKTLLSVTMLGMCTVRISDGNSFHPLMMRTYSWMQPSICKAHSLVSTHLNFLTPSNFLAPLKNKLNLRKVREWRIRKWRNLSKSLS